MRNFVVHYALVLRDFAKPPGSANGTKFSVRLESLASADDKFMIVWTGLLSNFNGELLRPAETRTMMSTTHFQHDIVLSDQELIRAFVLEVTNLGTQSQESMSIGFHNIVPSTSGSQANVSIRSYSQGGTANTPGWKSTLLKLSYTDLRTLEREDHARDHCNPILEVQANDSSTKAKILTSQESNFIDAIVIEVADMVQDQLPKHTS